MGNLWRCVQHFRWQVFGLDDLRWRHHRQPVANVLQLAHIARKTKLAELLQCGIRDAFGLHTELFGALLQEVPSEGKHVFSAFAQSRQPQANHIQPVIQVLAERAIFDALLQVLMRGGNHTRIGFDGVVPPHTVKVSVTQYAQQTRLQVERHVANFIQEQRAALGLFKAAPAHGLRTGKSAAFVAKQFALQQIFRDSCGIDSNKRPVGAA